MSMHSATEAAAREYSGIDNLFSPRSRKLPQLNQRLFVHDSDSPSDIDSDDELQGSEHCRNVDTTPEEQAIDQQLDYARYLGQLDIAQSNSDIYDSEEDANDDPDAQIQQHEPERQQWQVQHDVESHKLTVSELSAIVEDRRFDGYEALNMLQSKYSIDYGDADEGSAEVDINTPVFPEFRLDLLIIVGEPLQPLAKAAQPGLGENVSICLKSWHAQYSENHTTGINFSLTNRTFRLGHTSRRESLYIVMHPIQADESSAAKGSTAMRSCHADQLSQYIIDTFNTGPLVGCGIEKHPRLHEHPQTDVKYEDWARFQEYFMQGWSAFRNAHQQDFYWQQHNPAFHAYDYGGHDKLESDTSAIPNISLSNPHAAVIRPPLIAYTDSLRDLETLLERRYNIRSILIVTYAIATDLQAMDGREEDIDRQPPLPALYTLANRNRVAEEYDSKTDYTFYPLAFNEAFGNFSSPGPPLFMQKCLLPIVYSISDADNDGREPIELGSFQGYQSGLKRTLRHGPDELLATKGISTAALTLPAAEVRGARMKGKRDSLIKKSQGDGSQEAKPFARERSRLVDHLASESFPFRFEQVITVHISRLRDANRTFYWVLNPILHLMRFFIQEKQDYIGTLHSFKPSIFPGILITYSTMIERILEIFYQDFSSTGLGSMNLARSEGTAMLDRLGSYLFTGFAKSLHTRIFNALGTMDSLKRKAWPYIDPTILDLRGIGRLKHSQWPKSKDSKPLLLHLKSIEFHYGESAATTRRITSWFDDFFADGLDSPVAVEYFLTDLLRDAWIPQMMDFVQTRFLATDDSFLDWSRTEYPFASATFTRLLGLGQDKISSQTRSDYAASLYKACREKTLGFHGHATKGQTWFDHLRLAISKSTANEKTWLSCISLAMSAARIESLPGTYRGVLTMTHIIHLVGHKPNPFSFTHAKSLRRKAVDALARPAKRIKQWIKLQRHLPFQRVPEIISQGFTLTTKTLQKGDPRVSNHYDLAQQVLSNHIEHTTSQLIILLACTLASSTKTPAVEEGVFTIAKKNYDHQMWAACFVTRALWYFFPDSFPSTSDSNLLCIKDMLPKIEHKGVPSNMYILLGLVRNTGNSKRPKHTALRSISGSEVETLMLKLKEQLEDAQVFLAAVFKSADSIWADRCDSLIESEFER